MAKTRVEADRLAKENQHVRYQIRTKTEGIWTQQGMRVIVPIEWE